MLNTRNIVMSVLVVVMSVMLVGCKPSEEVWGDVDAVNGVDVINVDVNGVDVIDGDTVNDGDANATVELV